LSAEDIFLEEKIKREIKSKLSRGKVEVFIFSAKPQARKVYVDEETVTRYINQIKILNRKHNLKTDINIPDILSLPQAIFWGQRHKGDDAFTLSAVRAALAKLLRFKEKEGRAIMKEVRANLAKLKSNLERIYQQKPEAGEMENGREDIDEEISLALFYISKLEDKISSKRPVPKGKPIDFLTQEILRELNAASSKTKKKTLALLIMEGKNYLERIREQAQNVE
jgi:uncharacterized protein YicC (UPF0701 family)